MRRYGIDLPDAALEVLRSGRGESVKPGFINALGLAQAGVRVSVIEAPPLFGASPWRHGRNPYL
jgi:hypothetical protein